LEECRIASPPDEGANRIAPRRKLLGDFELNVAFRFGGTPYEIAERSLKLFAKEVLPIVKAWRPAQADTTVA